MYLALLIGVACAIFFYRAAEYERMSPGTWAGASLGLAVIVATVTSGVIPVLLAQAGLFAVMWWYNVYRKGRPKG